MPPTPETDWRRELERKLRRRVDEGRGTVILGTEECRIALTSLLSQDGFDNVEGDRLGQL